MARGRKAKERKSSLWAAPGIGEQVMEIVGEVRAFLQDDKFITAWTDKRLKLFGCEVMVNATVVGGKAAALIQGLPSSQLPEERESQFFLICINDNRWNNATAEQRLFALDIAICSCGKNDKGGLCRIMPDGVFYTETVRRRGVPTSEMKSLAKVIQAALPGLEEAEKSAEVAAEVERSGLTTAMSAEEAAELVREDPLADEQAQLDAEPSRTEASDPSEETQLPRRPRRSRGVNGDGAGLPAPA